MSKKVIKYIFELIFIFVLPFLFILPNITISDSYVYDNEGNFASSDKVITYDSSLYKSTYREPINYLFKNGLSEWISCAKVGYVVSNYIYLYSSSNANIFMVTGNNNLYIDIIGDQTYTYSSVSVENVNGINYYTYHIDPLLNLGSNPSIDYGYYGITTEKTSIQIFRDFINNSLYLNESSSTNIIFDYTLLWFIMFVIWHIIYLVIDKLFHLRRE